MHKQIKVEGIREKTKKRCEKYSSRRLDQQKGILKNVLNVFYLIHQNCSLFSENLLKVYIHGLYNESVSLLQFLVFILGLSTFF